MHVSSWLVLLVISMTRNYACNCGIEFDSRIIYEFDTTDLEAFIATLLRFHKEFDMTVTRRFDMTRSLKLSYLP